MSEFNSQESFDVENKTGKFYVMPKGARTLAIIFYAVSMALAFIPVIVLQNGSYFLNVCISMIMPAIVLVAIILLNKVSPIVLAVAVGASMVYGLISSVTSWVSTGSGMTAVSLAVSISTQLLAIGAKIMFILLILTRKTVFRVLTLVFEGLVANFAIVPIAMFVAESYGGVAMLSVTVSSIRTMLTSVAFILLTAAMKGFVSKKV